VVDYAIKHNFKAIAYTYNEPTILLEFVIDVMKLAKKNGIINVWVTNGYISNEAFEKVKTLIDAANIDLKAFNEKFYKKHCGGKLVKVLENVKKFHKSGIWIELTTLLIPGENDSSTELKNLACFISDISKDIPWFVSKFHPDYKMVDKEITKDRDIENAINIGKSYGLKHVYAGNFDKYNDTYCSKCKKIVIKRNYHEVESMNLNIKDGKANCMYCGEILPGIF